MRSAQGTGLGFEFTFGETEAGRVSMGVRENGGSGQGDRLPVFGVRHVGVWEAQQDEVGPSVLVSVPTDQHLLLGAEEGIFILNRNDQEATLEMVSTGPEGQGQGDGVGGCWGLMGAISPVLCSSFPAGLPGCTPSTMSSCLSQVWLWVGWEEGVQKLRG